MVEVENFVAVLIAAYHNGIPTAWGIEQTGIFYIVILCESSRTIEAFVAPGNRLVNKQDQDAATKEKRTGTQADVELLRKESRVIPSHLQVPGNTFPGGVYFAEYRLP